MLNTTFLFDLGAQRNIFFLFLGVAHYLSEVKVAGAKGGLEELIIDCRLLLSLSRQKRHVKE